MFLLRSVPLLCLAGASLLAGCSSDSSSASATPASIAAASAVTLNGTVGAAVTTPPSVTVTSSKGGPLEGATVTFAASGSSTATGTTVTTGANGVATVGGWTLGQGAGNYTMTATVGSLAPVTFTATAAPGAPASLTVFSGGAQSATVGTAVPAPIVILVKDQYANPVPSIAVTLAVTAGAGNLSAATAQTNAEGKATLPTWTLGLTSGANTVTATAGTATPLLVGATGTAGAPVAIQASAGDGQAGGITGPLATPLAAKVVDANGNGVTGTTVTFTLTSGGAVIATPSAVSNAQGIASTNVTLNQVGVTTITASGTALTPVVFSVSTGPTITGQITIGAVTSMSAGASKAAAPRGLLSLPTTQRQQPLTAEQAAKRIDTRGRIVVTFKPQSLGLPQMGSAAYRSGGLVRSQAVQSYQQVLTTHVNMAQLRESAVEPAIAAARIVLADPTTQDDVMAELRRDPRIATVEQEGVSYALTNGKAPVPPATVFLAEWTAGAASRTAPASERYASDPMLYQQLWQYRMIDAFRTWPLTTGSTNVRVGVIDTGIRPDHPGLAGMVSTTEGFDFTDGVTTAFSFAQPVCTGGTFLTVRGLAVHASLPRTGLDPMQYEVDPSGTCWMPETGGSHGTHVAGTIASAANDGIGGTGVNWSATIIPIRVLGVTGAGWDFDVATAIAYAGGMAVSYTGAPVGFSVQIPPIPIVNMSLGSTTSSTAKANAITAVAGTTLIIASAGNNANSVPNYPGAYPEVVAVSALRPAFGLAYYSNFGSYVSLSAPGGDLVQSASSGVLSTTWNFATGSANYSYYQGTSMASPHVAGVAALIKAMNPSFTAAQIKDRLISGAVDRGAAGRDNIYGYGVVNAYRSVTGTTGPAVVTTVRAVNTSGAIAATATVGIGGTFAFTNLPASDYQIVASQDEAGDGVFGYPGRRFGGAGTLQTVAGTTVRNVAFTLASLGEIEPNNTTGTAQPVVVNSWIGGELSSGADIDLYSVTIPTAGTYSFETSGMNGACGVSLDAKTALRLLTPAGTVVASNANAAYPTASYPGALCSLISTALTPGQYLVEVTAATITGSYRLHVRSGN